MNIKNLANYPQQLGDGKMIGAAGTKSDERGYELDKLDALDQKRVKGNLLEVVEELPAPAENNDANKNQKEGKK